jgi:soluble lytic murein transglycosylase-like protein
MQIEELARDYGDGVPPALVYALVIEESGGQMEIVSSAGAVGLMQVMHRFHPDVDLTIPEINVKVGCQILASNYLYLNHIRASISSPARVDLYDWTSEDWVKRALAGYNMGPGNVVWYDNHPEKSWPVGVQRYCDIIWNLYQKE